MGTIPCDFIKKVHAAVSNDLHLMTGLKHSRWRLKPLPFRVKGHMAEIICLFSGLLVLLVPVLYHMP